MTIAADIAHRADGRTTRWAQHRAQRRQDLVESAIDAIRAHGHTLGMEEFAAAAGTSKTVLYRHFNDRCGLQRAINDAIETMVIARVGEAFSAAGAQQHPRQVLAAAVTAYVGLVEDEPNLYEFLFAVPTAEPTTVRSDLTHARVTLSLADRVRALLDQTSTAGHPPGTTELWSQSLLGLVRTGVDVWKRGEVGMTREQVVDCLTDLAWHGASTAFRAQSPTKAVAGT